MFYRSLADAVMVIHFAFILYVVFGGLLLFRWPKTVWTHLPVVAWGALISFFGWTCPLTPLENNLRHAAGQAGFEGGFVTHYIMPIVYPPGLTQELGLWLGLGVLAINATAYTLFLRRKSNQ